MRGRLLLILALVMMSSPGVAGDSQACRSMHALGIERLVPAMQQWIADHSRYPRIDRFKPMTRTMPREALEELVHFDAGKSPGHNPEACFEHGSVTIFLPDDFDPDDLYDRGTLVHELVHFAQLVSGAQDLVDCPAMLERNAYRLQVAYLDLHGYQWPEGLRRNLLLASIVLGRCPPGHVLE